MSSRSFHGRVALICLAGSLAACGGPQAPTTAPSQPGMLIPVQPGPGESSAAPGQASEAVTPASPLSISPLVTQSAELQPGDNASKEAAGPPVEVDPQLLSNLPASIPQDFAQSHLQTILADEFSNAFSPMTFQGQGGTYVGFAPGFAASILDRARFLPIDGIWIPYVFVQGSYVPLCFREAGTGFYFYPELVVVEGMFIPVYRVVTILLDPYSIFLPVEVPGEWISPIDIGEVPVPLAAEPEVIRTISVVNQTTVVNQITNLETNIVEPVAISPRLVARVAAVRQNRLAKLPARVRQRIEDRRAQGSPLVVPMTPKIQHNVAVRRQQEERIRRQASEIALQPPQRRPPPVERKAPIERRPAPVGRKAPAPAEGREPAPVERQAPAPVEQRPRAQVEQNRHHSRLFKEPAAERSD